MIFFFHCDGDIKVLQDSCHRQSCHAMDLAKRVSTFCGSLDNSTKINFFFYYGITAPGFECHISQARHNNTPPLLAGFIFYTDFVFLFFLPLSRLMF